MARVVVGVAGGIAAYKACEVVRRLREQHHDVTVVPTPAALEFVGRVTWQALTGRDVHTAVFDGVTEVPHVRLGREADLVVIVPATADLMARSASGRADDLLTSVLLTATCPVLLCPAMHTEMWQHAATRANVATLRSRGVVVLDPDSGRLTGADSGPGRLPDPAEIVVIAELLIAEPAVAACAASRDLAGQSVSVSAGGTREQLDPVRFVGNNSSGAMGVALARVAALRGADVTLVAANLGVPTPSGVTVLPVVSTADLDKVMQGDAGRADVVVMAAAPADYTPAKASDRKLSKNGDAGLSLQLRQTPDVLAGLGRRRRPGQVLVGFAAETEPDEGSRLERARAKRDRKGCDLLVVNDVSGGAVFGADSNAVHIVDENGARAASGSKTLVAHRIWDAVASLRGQQN